MKNYDYGIPKKNIKISVNTYEEKSYIVGIIMIILISPIFMIKKIGYFRYLKSDEFHNDIFLLINDIIGYERIYNTKPRLDSSYINSFKEYYLNDENYKISKQFNNLDVRSKVTDSSFIIYLLGFDKKDDNLQKYKSFRDIKWWDIFTFKGDIIVDNLSLVNIGCDHPRMEIYLMKDNILDNDSLIRMEILGMLKKYTYKISDSLDFNERNFIYFKLRISDGDIEIYEICDEGEILLKHPGIKNDLLEKFKPIKNLNYLDEVYFTLFLSPVNN